MMGFPRLHMLAIAVTSIGLTACQGQSILSNTLTTFGPDPVIESESFQKIDLVVLLDPNPAKVPLNPGASLPEKQRNLAVAYKGFYKSVKELGTDDAAKKEAMRRRNRVQERILGASVQRCNEYKNFIKGLDASHLELKFITLYL